MFKWIREKMRSQVNESIELRHKFLDARGVYIKFLSARLDGDTHEMERLSREHAIAVDEYNEMADSYEKRFLKTS